MKNNFLISVILMTSLIVPVIPVQAEGTNYELSYNDSIFKTASTAAVRGESYPDYMYNCNAIPDSKIITLNDIDFQMNGSYDVNDGKDVIKITANQETAFDLDSDGKYTKQISVLGAGYTEDITADVKLYYSNNTTETIEVAIGAMTSQGSVSYGMGNNITVAASGRLLVFKEGTENVYLNYAQVNPSKAKLNKFSITADNDMFVAAISYTEYTQEELQGDMEENLKLLEQYKDLTCKDISYLDMENLEKLLQALNHAKQTGHPLGTDENIELAENLINGYLYYAAVSEQTNNIENAAQKYISDGEFTTEAEDILDKQTAISELEALKELLVEYEGKSDIIEDLKQIYVYFDLEYDIGDIAYTSGQVNQYIEDIKTAVINSDTTIPEQRNIELKYDTDLFFGNGGTNTQIWEELSNSFYQLPNFNVGIIDWVTDNKFKFDIKPAIMTESGEYKEGTSKGSVTIEYSQDRLHSDALYNNDGRGKDTLKLLPGGAGVKVTMSSKAASGFYLLAPAMDGVSKLSVDAQYYDGTVENIQAVVLARGNNWESKYNCENYQGRLFSYPGRLYAGKISNIDFELVLYKIPLNAEKQIKSLQFKSPEKEFFIMAINEIPLSNAEIKNNIEKLYQEVVNEEGIISDLAKIKQFVGYYNEMSERNMKISAIDEEKVSTMKEMILEITPSIYRKDKATIKADFEFNEPINTNTLNTKVLLNDSELTDCNTIISNNDKKMEIEIKADKATNGTISVVIDKSLSLKKYPWITMQYDYEVSEQISEFVTAELDEATGMLKLTNNSNTAQQCIINSGVYNTDFSKIYSAKSESVTLAGGESVVKPISLYSYYESITSEDKQFYLSVTDESLKPICEVSEVKTAGTSVAGADYKEPVLMLDTNTLFVNGYADKNEIVTIRISDIANSTVYTGNIFTNDDGYFEFKIVISESNVTSSGYLTIEIGAESFSKKYVNNGVYYSTVQDRYGAVNSIAYATNADEMKNAVADASKKLALNFTPFTLLRENGTYDAALVSRILTNADTFEKINDTDAESAKIQKVAKAQLIIKQLSVLEAIKQGLAEAVIGKDGLLYDDVMGYSAIDTDGVTLYNIYKTAVSENGINQIHKNIMSKDYADIDSMLKDLKVNIPVYAIKYAKQSGTGHISEVLTNANIKELGINADKYVAQNDKSEINKYILNASFDNLKELEAVIGAYKKSTQQGSSGIVGSSSGGSGSESAGKPFVMTNSTEITEVKSNNVFSDVDSSHWAYEAIEALYKKNIISGTGEGKFSPNESVTRAELIKMLCVANNIAVSDTQTAFDDVKSSDWFAPYVAAGCKNGWIYGTSSTEFAPNEKVTRQDICTIIYRTGHFNSTEEASFIDFHSIPEYAKAPVAALSDAGIINGFEDNTFRPLENCTRAQAAVIIYRYINR